MSEYFDIVIVGGGLVGASLACALADSGLNIAVVDAKVGTDSDAGRFDERTIALAWGARQIFESMGVWAQIAAGGVTPIHTIHVSDRSHLGLSRLHREEEGVDALGYIVPMRVMGSALTERLAELGNVQQFCPAQVTHIDISDDTAQLRIIQDGVEQTLQARLVIGADGVQSAVRDLAGIDLNRIDYHQHAVIANVASEFAHDNVAFERFTDSVAVRWSGQSATGTARHCWNCLTKIFLRVCRHALVIVWASLFTSVNASVFPLA
jgi:2-octaprenyl-6-methoxyphenol hydroxylase